MITRRGLLGMFAAGAGAAIVTTPGLLMRVKPLRDRSMAPEQFDQYLHKLSNPPMVVVSDEYAGRKILNFRGIPIIIGDTISFPKLGDEIVVNKNLWRVSWSTSSQFRIHP